MSYVLNRNTEILICDPMTEIKIMPDTKKEEILQCLKTIVTNYVGSCPMARDIGIGNDPLHRKDNWAKAIITRDVYVAIQDQEPRADARKISFDDTDVPGVLLPVVEVRLDG